MYEGFLEETKNIVKRYQELYNAIPHICSCCVGCENEKVDNSGCEYGFIPCAEKIERLIKGAHKQINNNLIPLTCVDRKNGDAYWYITSLGEIECRTDRTEDVTKEHYDVGNYCRDKDKMKNRALKETLGRLLWRYCEQHGGDSLWNDNNKHWIIWRDNLNDKYCTTYCLTFKPNLVFFPTEEIAKSAINEVIIPFIQLHPDFEW